MNEKISVVDILKKELVGKKLIHKNQHYRTVSLEVEDVKSVHQHVQITPDTPQNDWWGESKDWDELKIYFVDGSNIQIGFTSELEIDK